MVAVVVLVAVVPSLAGFTPVMVVVLFHCLGIYAGITSLVTLKAASGSAVRKPSISAARQPRKNLKQRGAGSHKI